MDRFDILSPAFHADTAATVRSMNGRAAVEVRLPIMGWITLCTSHDTCSVVRAIPGVVSVVKYLRTMSRAGSDAAPDGLIAALRDAEIDGRRLTEDEQVSMIFLLFGAGQETTTHPISGGLLEILRHDDQRRRLQDDMSLMPLCVEECGAVDEAALGVA